MKIILRSALICACLVLIASCQGGGGPSGGGGSANLRLAFVTNNASDFWTIARKGTEKADTELNDVSVEFGPFGGTAPNRKAIATSGQGRGKHASPVDPDNKPK